MNTYDKAKGAIMEYNLELADWESRKENLPKKDEVIKEPPSKQSIKQ